MWIIIVLGCLLILVTTFIHGLTTRFVMRLVMKHASSERKHQKYPKEFWVSIVVLIMFFASIIESVIWAVNYIALHAIQGLEQALYFSLVTYTTLGYGDITLDDKWRLLASFEAANGIIIFGWSTAIIMAVVQKLYAPRK